jgi:gluconate 2-dehydrogenase gamma chain
VTVTRSKAAARETAPARAPLWFTEPEWRALEAVVERIIPTTATAGARVAGVVQFINGMLATHYSLSRTAYREGLRRLAELSASKFGRGFEALDEGKQDQLLAMLECGSLTDWREAPNFFEMVRAHAIEGFFSDPKYGGNRDRVGWEGLL